MKNELHYEAIPALTGNPNYRADSDLAYLADQVQRYVEDGLDMNPDFQRGHVWTERQKVLWIEFLLRGGRPSSAILLNCVGWEQGKRGDFVLVDGKQRLTATLDFMADKLRVFRGLSGREEGWLASEMPARILRRTYLSFGVNSLETRKEVLNWYLELNEGTVAHADSELDRVRELIKLETQAVS